MAAKDQLKQSYQEFCKEIVQLNSKNFRKTKLKADEELERLLSYKFYNPYDVLLLEADATDEEIKKQFRNFALIIHPDKNKDQRTKQAWEVINKSYKTLMDQEKRKVYIRIMKQAKQRTQYQRNKKNRKRQKQGNPPLPQDTFEYEFRENCKKLYLQLQQRKKRLERLQMSFKEKKLYQAESTRLYQQYRILTQQEWQKTRDQRVGNWRNFNTKKNQYGARRFDNGIKPPTIKPQQKIIKPVFQAKNKK